MLDGEILSFHAVSGFMAVYASGTPGAAFDYRTVVGIALVRRSGRRELVWIEGDTELDEVGREVLGVVREGSSLSREMNLKDLRARKENGTL